MENNSLQIEIITTPDQKNGMETSMKKKLVGSLASVSSENCCIYKVPEFIFKGNEQLYRPSVMSIGPVYFQDEKLETMQEVKWIYLNCFLQHPQNACPSLEDHINFVRENEDKIRGYYQQQIRFSSDVFIEMIVLDAAFLVYYFMCEGDICDIDSPSLENKLRGLMAYLAKDLFLLENQLPFFVLTGIFNLAFGDLYEASTFINLSLVYVCMGGIVGPKAILRIILEEKITDASSIKHLVDLQRVSCCLSLNLPLRNQPNVVSNNQTDSVSYIRKVCGFLLLCCGRRHLKRETNYSGHLSYTAKQLKDSGVKFVASETHNPLDITFADGKLTISKLQLNDNTEPLLRSIIFFEQCHYTQDSYFIDYIFFLDELIDTVEDVQVLVKNEILDNILGSDIDVINLFNNIGKNLNLSGKFYYSDVGSAVNRYASTRWNRWMAILRRNYLNHPWVILSVIAAFILFILTLLQTIASFTR